MKRNIKPISILIVIGLLSGYFLDQSLGKIYKNEIIVTPKFNSVDYLYTSVNNYKSNILLLEDRKRKQIVKIKIEPIEDIYSFVGQKEQNLETFKILAENGDVKKLLTDSNTSKNYKYHKLVIYTNVSDNYEIVSSYLNLLNTNPFYKEKQKVNIKNTQIRIQEYKNSINQINTILNKLGSNDNVSTSNNLNINTNSQLNDIIKTKSAYVDDLNWLELDQIEQKKIIFDLSQNLNIQDDRFILFRAIVFVPAILVLLFVLVFLFKKIYHKYV